MISWRQSCVCVLISWCFDYSLRSTLSYLPRLPVQDIGTEFVNMSYYEAQSWQIPAQQASWEQPPPPSRMGRPIEEKLSPQTEAQKHAGTSSALQHDNVPAFDDQIEGMSSRNSSSPSAPGFGSGCFSVENQSPKPALGLEFALHLY